MANLDGGEKGRSKDHQWQVIHTVPVFKHTPPGAATHASTLQILWLCVCLSFRRDGQKQTTKTKAAAAINLKPKGGGVMKM